MDRQAAGSARTASDLVFVTEVGTPIDPSNLRRDFTAVCEKAGLGRWHPHELRASAASIMPRSARSLGGGRRRTGPLLDQDDSRLLHLGHILSLPEREAAAVAIASALWPIRSLLPRLNFSPLRPASKNNYQHEIFTSDPSLASLAALVGAEEYRA